MKKKFFIPPSPGTGAPTFSSPWLAPLAGYSDLPFRLLCRGYGATVCETEMISARGLVYESPGTGELLLSAPDDQPLVVQLFGSDAPTLAGAVSMLRKAGYNNFDFNMGCPVRKVLKQKAGAALMADLPRSLAIARAMIAAGREEGDDLPHEKARFGFKLRLPTNGDLRPFAHALEDAGADWLTLHPRTAAQGYTGKANWEKTAELVQMVSIPVIASGDLPTAAAGMECLEKTGAATIMYARGALLNPAIFGAHRTLRAGHDLAPPTPSEIRAMIFRHLELARESFNERRAFGKMRSLLPRYVKGMPWIREFRANLCMCNDWASLVETIDNFWKEEGQALGDTEVIQMDQKNRGCQQPLARPRLAGEISGRSERI